MKDLRTVTEPDSLLATVIQQPQFKENPYQRVSETWFKLKKNWKVIVKWLLAIMFMFCIANHPVEIGDAIGGWIADFTISLNKQLNRIK